jgi:DNA-binding NarL/FixJ family response regulator
MMAPDDRLGAERPITVVVADDQDIVRDGLVTVLSLVAGIDVVGAARTGAEAVELAARLHPDVVLMDLRMPVLDGPAATAILRRDQPDVAVLVLTTFDDDASIAAALAAGARGYLTKDASRDDIAIALRAVAHGQATFDRAVSDRLVAGLAVAPAEPAPEAALLADLTARERDVLRLIGSGLNNTEIADALFVSTSTVKTHINNLFAKLHLRDRAQAVRRAGEIFGPPA